MEIRVTNILIFVFTTWYSYSAGEKQQVCFKRYGCFSRTTPFQSDHAVLPDDPKVIQTKFYLFTRHNRYVAELLDVNRLGSIANSHFNPKSKTVVIIHGYSHHASKPWVLKMKYALLKRSSFNVITVDWRKGAAFSLFYMKAVANARLVGAQTSYLIRILRIVTGVSPRSIHIVGHSLGAHVAGYAGRRLTKKNMLLRRITGLDPARLEYEDAHTDLRLDKSDARFVDVIHTNAAPFLFGGVGYRGRLGHVDFYPNGGEYQPGCESLFRTIWEKGVYNAATCNHMRSVEYFTVSISGNCQYIAFPCSSWESFKEGRCFKNNINEMVSRMGYDAEQYFDRRGIMYMTTIPTRPYCVYSYLITVSFKNSRTKFNIVYVKIIGTEGATKDEKVKLPEGMGSKFQLITTNSDLGKIKSIELMYYGFDSFFVGHVQANIVDKNQTYTACFNKKITNSFWAFWTQAWTKHSRKADLASTCISQAKL